VATLIFFSFLKHVGEMSCCINWKKMVQLLAKSMAGANLFSGNFNFISASRSSENLMDGSTLP